MKIRNAITTAIAVATMAAATLFAADPPARKSEPIYGYRMMNDQERNEYRERMRNARSAGERQAVRDEHRKLMEARAKERGVTLPEPRGPGAGGPGAGGPGAGGPGAGGPGAGKGPGYGPQGKGPGYGPQGKGPGYGPQGKGPGYGPQGKGPGYGPQGKGPGYGPQGKGPGPRWDCPAGQDCPGPGAGKGPGPRQ